MKRGYRIKQVFKHTCKMSMHQIKSFCIGNLNVYYVLNILLYVAGRGDVHNAAITVAVTI